MGGCQKQQYGPQPAYNKGGYQRGYAPQPAYNNGGYQRQQYAPQPAYNKGGYQKGYGPQPAYNREVTKDNNMLHNQPTTREVTKRVMVTEDTLHNQLITREVTNQTTEDTTNKNKMFVRSSLNEWGKNTEIIFLFFIFALKNEPNKLF